MEINTSYLSDHNTYRTNNPGYIVVHNTDNFSEGADARAHAYAQFHGNCLAHRSTFIRMIKGLHTRQQNFRGAAGMSGLITGESCLGQ